MSRIKSLNFFSESSKIKSGEYLLNQIHIQKKISQKKTSITKRSHHSNNLEILDINKKKDNMHLYSIKSSKLQNNNNINNNLNTESSSIPKYINHEMSKNEEKNIRKALKQHFVFKDINDKVLSIIIKELIYFPLPKGRIVYEEGDNGNFFYILASGKVESYEKGNLKKVYLPWDCFGELSLLTKKKREETIKCIEKSELFTLEREIFLDIQRNINESILKERFNFLNTISIFKSLDNISKYNVAQKIELKEFKENDKIISKGDIGDNLYIIKEGLVSIKINNNEIRKLGNNDYFGQNCIILENIKRGADVFSIKNTICYSLSKNNLKDALGNHFINVILLCFFKYTIEQNKNLKSIFIESLLEDLFKVFKLKVYKKNEKIFDCNNEDKLKSNSKRLIIVVEGSIYINKNNNNETELIASKGDIIGESLFKDNKKEIGNNLFVNPDCITLESDILSLCKILKIDLNNEKPLNILNIISKLKKIYLFRNLSDKTLESLALKFKKIKFDENTVIYEQGELGDLFYIISKGKIQINQNNNYIKNLEKGDFFGENTLFQSNKRTETIKTIEKVVCYTLLKSDFDDIIQNKNIKNYLYKIYILQDNSIQLSDLYYIKFLGKGKFGNVSLVHNSKNIYAIKAISKLSVEKQKILGKYFKNERKIMLLLDHPFIVKLVKSLKNENYCFLLIENINGKNLDEYLSTRLMKKNIIETQFYSGSIFLMLEYLQKKYIAHRDIKPSNIMIDSNGYLKMIDFGTSKLLKDYTSTIIGTPHYIPPEILQGKGYSLSCDFWSVGICIYEIFYGFYPFGNYSHEIIEIYKEILNKKNYTLSKNPLYIDVNNLIQKLLNKKVNERLCNINIIKQMDFFKNFSFDELIDFKIKPPYIPKINNNDFNFKLNEKNEKYEDFLIKNYPNDIFEKSDNNDFNDCESNWTDEF